MSGNQNQDDDQQNKPQNLDMPGPSGTSDMDRQETRPSTSPNDNQHGMAGPSGVMKKTSVVKRAGKTATKIRRETPNSREVRLDEDVFNENEEFNSPEILRAPKKAKFVRIRQNSSREVLLIREVPLHLDLDVFNEHVPLNPPGVPMAPKKKKTAAQEVERSAEFFRRQVELVFLPPQAYH